MNIVGQYDQDCREILGDEYDPDYRVILATLQKSPATTKELGEAIGSANKIGAMLGFLMEHELIQHSGDGAVDHPKFELQPIDRSEDNYDEHDEEDNAFLYEND